MNSCKKTYFFLALLLAVGFAACLVSPTITATTSTLNLTCPGEGEHTFRNPNFQPKCKHPTDQGTCPTCSAEGDTLSYTVDGQGAIRGDGDVITVGFTWFTAKGYRACIFDLVDYPDNSGEDVVLNLVGHCDE